MPFGPFVRLKLPVKPRNETASPLVAKVTKACPKKSVTIAR
jgi:hypothetical protein